MKMDSSSSQDVFSKRKKPVSDTYIYDVSQSFRNRIFLLLNEVFDTLHQSGTSRRKKPSRSYYETEFWDKMHRALLSQYGKLQLSEGGIRKSKDADCLQFLQGCEDECFLDFIELIFRIDLNLIGSYINGANSLVQRINDIFVIENLGYELTELVQEITVPKDMPLSIAFPDFANINILANPKIITKDRKITHALIRKPALTLLSNSIFENANVEYLEALDFYKNGNYFDCLGRCGSAFESVMKIVCEEKGWPFDQKNTASRLIDIIIENSNLETFYKDPLTIVATLRNKISKAHGAGAVTKKAPKHIARYALNATASAITLIVDETM